MTPKSVSHAFLKLTKDKFQITRFKEDEPFDPTYFRNGFKFVTFTFLKLQHQNSI